MEAEFKESYWIRKQTYPVSKIPKLRKRPQANQSCGYLTSGRWNLIRFSQTDKELLITLRALPYNIPFSSAQSLCRVRLFVTPWTAARQASLVHYLPEFAQTHVHWIVDAIQTSHPLSPPSSKSITLQLKFFIIKKKLKSKKERKPNQEKFQSFPKLSC